jgi:hypothetical protein
VADRFQRCETAASSPMTTMRSTIVGRRPEHTLLAVQGMAVSIDVQWTVVALSLMTTMRSSMVGERGGRVLGVGNPAPSTRTGGTRMRAQLRATRNATSSEDGRADHNASSFVFFRNS